MKLSKDQLHDTAVNYLPREGGFASRLADAYLYADSDNKRRIEDAFMDLFENAYEKWCFAGTGSVVDWEDRPPETFASARECAIDEQAQLMDDPYDD
jgi:hypothetical protein